MTDEKPNKPELIEDEDLDQASGGLAPNALKISTTEDAQTVKTYSITNAWPSKIEIGSLKAGDGSV